MIFLKTDDEIELLRQSNLLVGKTLAEVAKLIKPGVTTKELDKLSLNTKHTGKCRHDSYKGQEQ